MKQIGILLFVVVCVYAAPKTPKDPIKARYMKDYSKRVARQALLSGITGTGGPGSESCTAYDCNNRGTCLGSKASPVCVCVIGYAGSRCEDTHCDSARDCNGRGLCFGTATQFSCMCHYGYGGNRCEYVTSTGSGTAPAAPAQQQVVYGQQQPGAYGQQSAYGPGTQQQAYPQQGYQQGK